MVVIVIKYKKISVDVSWHILLLSCVLQFDTMQPRPTLGVILMIGIFLIHLNYCGLRT